MTICYELDLNSFQAWSGAKSTLERIQREDKCAELEAMLDDLYPDGMTETQLNDLLWFDSEQVYEWLGLRTEEQIQAEIDEVQTRIDEIVEEMEELVSDWTDETSEMAEEERNQIWQDDYKDSWDELKDEAEELKETIAELKEEYAAL